jgi:Resolvase, N terminal domain
VKAKGATLKATEQPIDTATAAGKCFLDMLGVFAEFETNLRKERQLEGIATCCGMPGKRLSEARGRSGFLLATPASAFRIIRQ